MSRKPAMAPAKPSVPAADTPKPDPAESDAIKKVLRTVGGSANHQFNSQLADAVMDVVWWPKGATEESRGKNLTAVMAGMISFKPADEIEGMLAAQAIAMHHASMECSRRAMIPDQGFEAGREYRKAAANASRAFVELLAALDRKRGKGGQQKVTVEHVHVHAGGKAIVGAVSPSAATGGGGGSEGKARDEPHAPPAALEHDATAGAVLPPLWCAGAQREPVPIAGDAQRPLPHARGR